MNQNLNQNQNEATLEIDLIQLLGALWHRIWLVILCTIVGAAIAFASTVQFAVPKYKANVSIYVINNGTASGLAAAQSLVATYIEILKSRPALEKIIDEADLDISTSKLRGMIKATSKDGTEIFDVAVISENREETVIIANAIATVLPDVLSAVVDKSSVKVIEPADGSDVQISPNLSKNTVTGALIGLVLSIALVVLKFLFDPYVKSEEDISKTYNLPLLAVIPTVGSRNKRGKYYRSYRAYSGYGRTNTHDSNK